MGTGSLSWHWLVQLFFIFFILIGVCLESFLLLIVRIVKLEAGFVGCACGSLQHGFYLFFIFLTINWGQVFA